MLSLTYARSQTQVNQLCSFALGTGLKAVPDPPDDEQRVTVRVSSCPWESFSGQQHSLERGDGSPCESLAQSNKGIQRTGMAAPELPRGMGKAGPGLGQGGLVPDFFF